MYRYWLWDPNTNYQPWELKHVEKIKFSVNKSSQAYGLPTKSSSATQVFENQGPIATIQLSFTRFDYEEDVPNWDFMFTKDYKKNGLRYKGIDWYTSRLQTRYPYKFSITWTDDNIDAGDPGLFPVGEWLVGVTNVGFSTDSSTPGKMEFSISLTERR